MKANHIVHGDVRSELHILPKESVDCVITSPPYFRLRNYGDTKQIGLEATVDGWVEQLRNVFIELARVLKPAGSVWLNLGDSYSRTPISGAPAKGLLLAPERLLLKLADDGWIVRNKVIWAKRNPMPSSVKDRLTTTHEFIYFLTRSPQYFFDLDAIRIPQQTSRAKAKRAPKTGSYPPRNHSPPTWAGPFAGNNRGLAKLKQHGLSGHPKGKNPGDVWRLSTANFHGAHFATFPPDLVTIPILATCPERICVACGLGWQKSPQRKLGQLALIGKLQPTCTCAAEWKPGVVLDPFFGAGTVALVAKEHNRDWLGIEVNADYIKLAEQRLAKARDLRSDEDPPDELPTAA